MNSKPSKKNSSHAIDCFGLLRLSLLGVALSWRALAADGFGVGDGEINGVDSDPSSTAERPAEMASGAPEPDADVAISDFAPAPEPLDEGVEVNQLLDRAPAEPAPSLSFGDDDLPPPPTPAPLKPAAAIPLPRAVPQVLPTPPSPQAAIPPTPIPPPTPTSKPTPAPVAAVEEPASSAAPLSPLNEPDTSVVEELPVSTVDIGPRPAKVLGANDFAGAPPLPDSRRQMADGEAPEEYVVAGGDTLYDICDQLLDEPSYWPKLWAMNPEIRNPHFIYPGIRLRFYQGDADLPPFLQVVTEDDIQPVEKDASLSEAELATDPEDISKLLLDAGSNDLTDIIDPSALVGLGSLEDTFEFIDNSVDTGKLLVTIPAFILPTLESPLGVVVAGNDSHSLVDRPEEVVIQSSGGLSRGSTYTVLRPTESVVDELTGESVGERYEFVAHVRIIRDMGQGYLGAVVSENRLGVSFQDIVVPYKSTARSVVVTDNTAGSGGVGRTVLGFDAPDTILGGRGSFVYLNNLGKPMRVGENVMLYQQLGVMAGETIADLYPNSRKPVAIAKIIDTTDSAAVGYILLGSQEIRRGDVAGSGR